MTRRSAIYGLMAEFDGPNEWLAATRAAYDAGYRRMDAYSPFPVEELSDAIGFRNTRLPLIVLAGAILGGVLGFGLQYWCSAVNYPINVGGRPLNSWPAFIPITFELTVLIASLSAVLAMLVFNRLPQPNHPVFDV